jgi:hypothetical protein
VKKSLVRLAKLRDLQRQQAQALVHRAESDLSAARQCQNQVIMGRLGPETTQTAQALQHSDVLLGHLQRSADRLMGQVAEAQQKLHARARDAKQIEKIVAQQAAARAAVQARAESQAVEAWVRSRKKLTGGLS